MLVVARGSRDWPGLAGRSEYQILGRRAAVCGLLEDERRLKHRYFARVKTLGIEQIQLEAVRPR